jgi:hypothetical protein
MSFVLAVMDQESFDRNAFERQVELQKRAVGRWALQIRQIATGRKLDHFMSLSVAYLRVLSPFLERAIMAGYRLWEWETAPAAGLRGRS